MLSPLLFPDRVEGAVLEPPELELEELEVHGGVSTPVLALGPVEPVPLDEEDGETSPVQVAHPDRPQLAATGERISAQEEVLGLEHAAPPFRSPGSRPPAGVVVVSGEEVG
jgi:hypothetical protein